MYFVASMFVLEFPDVLGEFSAVFRVFCLGRIACGCCIVA